MSYGYPPAGYDPAQMRPVGSVWHASLKVRWPAIGLAAVSGLNLGICLVLMVASLQIVVPAVNRLRSPTPTSTSPGEPPTNKTTGSLLGGTAGAATLILSFAGLAASAFFSGMILVGTRKMRNVQSYFTSVTISIVAIIPGLSPLGVAGIPFGIWALMVLAQKDVRYAFRGRA